MFSKQWFPLYAACLSAQEKPLATFGSTVAISSGLRGLAEFQSNAVHRIYLRHVASCFDTLIPARIPGSRGSLRVVRHRS